MRKIAVLFCVLVVTAVPAAATEPIAPTLRAETVYFHCAGATKVANAHQAQDGSLPSWNTTAPAQSVQQGAGCGWADNSALRSPQAGDSPHDGAWRGTFTGNLRTLTARLHSISAGPGRTGAVQTVNATLTIDGVSMFGYAADGRAQRAAIRVTPVVSSSQASALYEFSIDNLPFVLEEGDGTTQRQVILNVAASSEPLMAWVYDTTEVPSGISFNPTTLAAVKVSATPPAE